MNKLIILITSKILIILMISLENQH